MLNQNFNLCSPCGMEAPYEPQYSPEGQGVQAESVWAPV